MFKKLNPYQILAKAPRTMRTSQYIETYQQKGLRIIRLNRPDKLNSLNLEMVEAMTDYIQMAIRNEACTAIVIEGNSKGFCAGGDVVSLLKEGTEACDKFFREEYALNHLIFSSMKPILSVIDGVTMGGGVGISLHGSHRIATEKTVWAMPECSIGFIPDVGSSFFLSGLPIGMYLALTGARLKGIDVYHAGIATHYIPSHRIEILKERMENFNDLNSLLEAHSAEYEPFSLEPHLKDIKTCFRSANLEQIRNNLKSLNNEWSRTQLEILDQQSPTALVATVGLLKMAKQLSFKDCLALEHAIAMQLVQQPDFNAGITTKLVEKSKNVPQWTCVQPINFSNLSKLKFLNATDSQTYLHNNELPSIEQVKECVSKYGSDAEMKIMTSVGNKLGLKELIENAINSKNKL